MRNQELFNFLYDNFGAIALEGEMQEIERIILESNKGSNS